MFNLLDKVLNLIPNKTYISAIGSILVGAGALILHYVGGKTVVDPSTAWELISIGLVGLGLRNAMSKGK